MQKVIAIVWTFQKEEHGFPLTMTGSWSGNMCYKRWKTKAWKNKTDLVVHVWKQEFEPKSYYPFMYKYLAKY